jgi:ABC-type uncharacterized transport system ATPase subunit
MYIIEAKGLVKKYKINGILACNSIDLSLRKGQTLAIMGENGAGKSTLVSLIEGSIQPSEGSMLYNGVGKPGIVHQKPHSSEDFLVWQHICAGNIELTGPFNIFNRELYKKINHLSKVLGCRFSAVSPMKGLHTFQLQQVELIEQILLDRDLIILDEPEFPGKDSIIEYIKNLGKTIMIVTHKIEEALNWGERIIIMRKGKIVFDKKRNNCKENELLHHFIPLEHHNSDQDFPYPDNKKMGNILVIAGLRESGLEEEEEKIIKEYTGANVAYLPSQYRQRAMESTWTVNDNILIHKRYHKINPLGLINHRNWNREGSLLIKQWGARAEGKEAMGQLSGGNQKKLLIMRELIREADHIILANPSLALDLENRKQVHREILKAKFDGHSLIILTDDPLEALQLADEIIPLYNKKRGLKKKASQFNKESLSAAMRGRGDHFE